jgi:hypothetical protein
MDPGALRLAQFFKNLTSLQHHLSAETALHALEEKLTEAIDNGSYDRKSREKRAKIILYGNELADYRALNFLVQREQLHELLEWLAYVYESFEDFLSDYLRSDSEPAPIDSYWNSYRADGHASEYYMDDEEMRNLFDSLG